MPDGVGAWHQEAASAPARIAVATARLDSVRPCAGRRLPRSTLAAAPGLPAAAAAPAMGEEDYYLELCDRPVHFEKANPVNCVFFDEANKQVRAGPLPPPPRGRTRPARRPRCLRGVPRAPRPGAGGGARPGASPPVPAPHWRQLRALGWAEGPGATSAGAFFSKVTARWTPNLRCPPNSALWPVWSVVSRQPFPRAFVVFICH